MTVIHSGGKIVFSFTHIESVTLDVGEEVNEIAGGASGMGEDRIGDGDSASEGQATGVYGTDFIVGSLARVGARRWDKGDWDQS